MKTDEFSNVIIILGISVKFWVRKYQGWKILQVERKKKKNAKNHKGGRILKNKKFKKFVFFLIFFEKKFVFFEFLTEMSTSEYAF